VTLTLGGSVLQVATHAAAGQGEKKGERCNYKGKRAESKTDKELLRDLPTLVGEEKEKGERTQNHDISLPQEKRRLSKSLKLLASFSGATKKRLGTPKGDQADANMQVTRRKEEGESGTEANFCQMGSLPGKKRVPSWTAAAAPRNSGKERESQTLTATARDRKPRTDRTPGGF